MNKDMSLYMYVCIYIYIYMCNFQSCVSVLALSCLQNGRLGRLPRTAPPSACASAGPRPAPPATRPAGSGHGALWAAGCRMW